jgi:hypothetical protein
MLLVQGFGGAPGRIQKQSKLGTYQRTVRSKIERPLKLDFTTGPIPFIYPLDPRQGCVGFGVGGIELKGLFQPTSWLWALPRWDADTRKVRGRHGLARHRRVPSPALYQSPFRSIRRPCSCPLPKRDSNNTGRANRRLRHQDRHGGRY